MAPSKVLPIRGGKVKLRGFNHWALGVGHGAWEYGETRGQGDNNKNHYLLPIIYPQSPVPNFLFPIYISSEASEVFDGENSLARALATNVQPAFNSF